MPGIPLGHQPLDRGVELRRGDAGGGVTEVVLHPGAQALKARRTCPTCGTERDYCISTKLGECNDCAFPQASPAAGDWDPEAARWGWQAGPDEQLQAEAG